MIHIASLLPDLGASNGCNEEVVLRNKGDTDFSVDGWSLGNKAGETVVLSGKISAHGQTTVKPEQTSAFLNRQGDEITLRNPDGCEAETVVYEAGDVQEGEHITFEEEPEE